jgi:hypothetical protein
MIRILEVSHMIGKQIGISIKCIPDQDDLTNPAFSSLKPTLLNENTSLYFASVIFKFGSMSSFYMKYYENVWGRWTKW